MRSLRLPVPSPALPERLDRFLVANVPDLSRRQVKGLLDAQQVRVNGRIERKAGRRMKPGEVVELNYRPSWQHAESKPAKLELAAQGDGWWIVHKPAGLSSHPDSDEDSRSIAEVLADSLGLGCGEATAVHRLDRGTSGLLLVALAGGARARFSAMFESRELNKQYLAIVHPAPESASGSLSGPEIDGGATELRWQVLRRSGDGSRAELQVEPKQGRTHQVRIQLASAGWPIVGDLDYGRPLPGGAPRMALHASRLRCREFDVQWPHPEHWQELLNPEASPTATSATREPSSHTPPKNSTQGRQVVRAKAPTRQLEISRASARIIRGGHPWLMKDRWTGDLRGLNTGETVWLVDGRGDYVATAIVDPGKDLCARVVSREASEDLSDATFRRRGAEAAQRRQNLLDRPDTNALRLIHGEADQLPGLNVDLWGDVLVATLSTAAARNMARAAYRGLQEQLGPLALYEQEHFADLRTRTKQVDSSLTGRWVLAPGEPLPESWQVLERGFRFQVNPIGTLSTGLYPDQRDNRERLEQLVKRQSAAQVANLFSHTGAFSVTCAAAGAGRVWSVDLSRPYSDLARANLKSNGLSAEEHPVVVADAHKWLQQEQPQLDGIIVDPPSRASGRRAGDRGWSTKRDYRGLIRAAASCLRPGGWVLCCSNLRGAPRGWLKREISAAVKEAGRRSRRLEPAPTAADFPPLRGFPEGRCFQAILLSLE